MSNTSHAVRSTSIQTFTLKPQKCEPHRLPAALMKSCLVNPLHVLSGETHVKLNSFITHHPWTRAREGWRTVLWKHSVPILWFDIVQISQVFLQKAVCHLLQTHSGTFSIVTPKILYEEPMDHRYLLSLGRRSRHFREAVMAVGSSMEHDGFHAVASASRSNP